MLKNCFQTALLPLKESSKAAIAGAVCESFGDVKSYLHIERDVEGELEKIIEKVVEAKNGKLVLVCGNVGDGKSHLISSLFQKYPKNRPLFKIYDDATESSSPTATNIEELRRILSPYADENLPSCDQHTILAINLGTLNNFIAADRKDNQKKFIELADYVQKKQILEVGRLEENTYNPNSCFQFVNFSDHNLFFLTNEGPVSSIIESALEKIVSLSNYNNPFQKAYSETCINCSANCPIKLNYELLQESLIRKKVSELLIQCIVKHHQIISIRALYNFIFDLLVPVVLDGLNLREISKWVKRSSSADFLQNLFPNYLFEHPEVSDLFDCLQHLDPSLRRNVSLDDHIVSLVTKEDPEELLTKVQGPNELGKVLKKHAKSANGQDVLVKTYVRLMFFSTVNSSKKYFDDDDTEYTKFMKLLYSWYIGDRTSLKKLYLLIQRTAMAWNGKAPNGEMLLELGNQQLKYLVSEEVSIQPGYLPVEKHQNSVVRKFSCLLPLKFKTSSGNNKEFSINVDYRLYEMACNVDRGARINHTDKNNFIAFTSFVDDIMRTGELGSRVRIIEAGTGQNFFLEKDTFGDFTFTEVQS